MSSPSFSGELLEQQKAEQYGDKLGRSLGLLYISAYILAVLGLIGSVVAITFININIPWLGIWGFMGSALGLLLTMAMVAVQLRALRALQEAVSTVTGYVGTGRKFEAAKVTTLLKWLTVGQWLLVISGLLNLVVLLGSSMLSGILRLVDDNAGRLGTALSLVMGIPSFVIDVVLLAMCWLFLAVIKKFLGVVMRRVSGEGVPVLPSAQTLSGWLMFALVLLVLSALISIPGVALAFLAARSSAGDSAPMGLFSLVLAIPLLLAVLVLIWQIMMVVWARRFVQATASALDAPLLATKLGGDPWENAVVEEQVIR